MKYKMCDRITFEGGPRSVVNAPVICIPGSPGAGDSGDIAGLKCQALTSDVSR